MAKVISIINYKGGVGKTTLTANMAAELARRGKRVLVVDVDAQSSLTFSFLPVEEWSNELKDSKTIKQIFDNDLVAPSNPKDLLVYPHEINANLGSDKCLALIASHIDLLSVDLDLAVSLGGANMTQAKKNFLKIHGLLSATLTELSIIFDFILLDCPPNFNIVTKNAIVAADYILIPTRPDYLSVLGISYLIKNLKRLKKEYNEYATLNGKPSDEIDPKLLGIVLTMVEYYNAQPIQAQQTYISRVKNLPEKPYVFNSMIRHSSSYFAGAPNMGVPVVLSSPAKPINKILVAEIRAIG